AAAAAAGRRTSGGAVETDFGSAKEGWRAKALSQRRWRQEPELLRDAGDPLGRRAKGAWKDPGLLLAGLSPPGAPVFSHGGRRSLAPALWICDQPEDYDHPRGAAAPSIGGLGANMERAARAGGGEAGGLGSGVCAGAGGEDVY